MQRARIRISCLLSRVHFIELNEFKNQNFSFETIFRSPPPQQISVHFFETSPPPFYYGTEVKISNNLSVFRDGKEHRNGKKMKRRRNIPKKSWANKITAKTTRPRRERPEKIRFPGKLDKGVNVYITYRQCVSFFCTKLNFYKIFMTK